MSIMKTMYKFTPPQPTYFDVFLGGTTNFKSKDLDWRTQVISRLNHNIIFYNPVVDDWNDAQQRLEKKAKDDSRIRLYVITPQMKGMFSIAEMVHDSIQFNSRTTICILPEYNGKSFSNSQLKSLDATLEMCRFYKANVLYTLDAVVEYINNSSKG